MGEHTVIAVLAEPGLGALSGMLGALAAGAAFLPLDPTLPDDRLDFMVADCGVRTILADTPSDRRARGIAERAEEAVRVIPIGDDATDDSPAAPDMSYQADPDEIAYVIYTSGSTGTPKGVAITHGNLRPLLEWSAGHFELGPGTRVIQNLNPAFDFGVWELLTTVGTGGTLYWPGRLGDLTPSAFAHALADWDIDTLHTTPAYFAELVAAGRPLHSLRQVHLGGDKLAGTLVEQAAAVLTDRCRLHNGYGPTETTVNCSVYVTDRGKPVVDDVVPIGIASAENLLYVLSAGLEPVADGETGELFVGGPGVARGYVGRPGLTAEKFLPDPWANEVGARMYRTGDLVRRRSDGVIDYLGRIDYQVKVRGHRLELGEIEAVLNRCHEVAEAVVVGVPVPTRPEAIRLVGYLVSRDPRPNSQVINNEFVDHVRQFAAERLPGYMVPTALERLERFPLTPNGKVDRAALPDPGRSEFAPERQVFATDDPAAVLTGIWADVLGVANIRLDDNFFDLGGDSLCALRVAEAAQSTGLPVNPTDVITAQTIGTLLGLIGGPDHRTRPDGGGLAAP
ncbi:amino acid adenylation domain-containing protein [Streptomyces sp. NPDC088256]|uniref:non-ribosomal peptide synthetase n=1 Tax=Streptomyces sp. NPDC088256 TaxID=3365848 RepID=UPI003816C654